MSRQAKVTATRLAVGDVASDKLLRLHRLWRERRGTRRWPARADFPPEDLAFVLGTLTLVDVLRDPLRFRIRLLGTSIEELRGRGDQGKFVEELEPDYYAAMLVEHYADAVDEGEPVFHLIQFLATTCPPAYPLAYERVILPLSAGGAAIDMLLIASDWSEAITGELRKYHETE